MALLKRASLPLTACLLLATSGDLPAIGNWGSSYSEALWDTPWQHFTEDDWKGFNATLIDTLDHAKDGETRTWSNEKTKASGEFTVLKSVVRRGEQCRELKIVAEASGLRRITGIAYCPDDSGSWNAIPGRNGKPF
jgi:hypothetical protein